MTIPPGPTGNAWVLRSTLEPSSTYSLGVQPPSPTLHLSALPVCIESFVSSLSHSFYQPWSDGLRHMLCALEARAPSSTIAAALLTCSAPNHVAEASASMGAPHSHGAGSAAFHDDEATPKFDDDTPSADG